MHTNINNLSTYLAYSSAANSQISLTFSSVQFSCSVVSDFFWPYGLQHASLPGPSQLWELTQTHVPWGGDAIQQSLPLSAPSPAFNLSQHQGLFQWVISPSVLPVNTQDWSPLGWTWRRRWHPTPVLLPGKSHGQRSLVGCSPWGSLGVRHDWGLHFHFSLSCIGEGNGNPLQCSCLENLRDRGAWWAAVYGIS